MNAAVSPIAKKRTVRFRASSRRFYAERIPLNLYEKRLKLQQVSFIMKARIIYDH